VLVIFSFDHSENVRQGTAGSNTEALEETLKEGHLLGDTVDKRTEVHERGIEYDTVRSSESVAIPDPIRWNLIENKYRNLIATSDGENS